jgi:hypothetical protein
MACPIGVWKKWGVMSFLLTGLLISSFSGLSWGLVSAQTFGEIIHILSGSGDPDFPQVEKQIAVLDSTIQELDRKYQTTLGSQLKHLVGAKSKQGTLSVVSQLVLLDMQDTLEATDVANPTEKGLRSLKITTMKTAVNYQLLSDFFQKQQPKFNEQVRTAFNEMMALLGQIDLTTNPEKFGRTKTSLVIKIVQLRQSLEKSSP